jgi:hypothetical protein
VIERRQEREGIGKEKIEREQEGKGERGTGRGGGM